MKSNIYNQKFYEGLKDASYKSASVIVPLLIDMLSPIDIRSAVDFGCGLGTWLCAFLDAGGQTVKGLDYGSHDDGQLYIDEDDFINVDLTRYIDLKRQFDLCLSLEVAEHIGEYYSEVFIENLCRHSDIIVFSAAVTGQGGQCHVNEQPQSYWVNMFKKKGYSHYDVIRPLVWEDKDVEPWYKQNIMLYIKDGVDISLTKIINNNSGVPIDIIHPNSFVQLRKEYDYLADSGIINKLYLSRRFPKLFGVYKSLKNKAFK